MLIAFTNHALDHMVTSVLDAEITDKIVRLGTRSTDERVSQYALRKLEELETAPTLDRTMRRQYAKMKELEEKMTKTMTSIRLPVLSWEKIERHLDIVYPLHAENIRSPPFWILQLYSIMVQEEEEEGEFEIVTHGKGKRNQVIDKTVEKSLYGFWRQATDIRYLTQPPVKPPEASRKSKGKRREIEVPTEVDFRTDPPAFFSSLGFGSQRPLVPASNRTLEELQQKDAVWSMSPSERARLADAWEHDIRRKAYYTNQDAYRRLKEEHRKECELYDEMKDDVSIIT